jgi:hypothetical protein
MGPDHVAADLGLVAAQGDEEMIERAGVIAALAAYQARLKAQGKLMKAVAVGRCIAIVRGL